MMVMVNTRFSAFLRRNRAVAAVTNVLITVAINIGTTGSKNNVSTKNR